MRVETVPLRRRKGITLAWSAPRTDDAGMLRPLLVDCLVAAVGLAGTVACSRKVPSPPSGSHVDAPGHPSTWFTAEEIGSRLGVNVGDARAAGPLGTSGEWTGANGVSVQIQIVRDVSFWSAPTSAKGYAPLEAIGKAAYLVDTENGAKASSLLEGAFVTVLVAGVADSRAAAQRLLVDTLPRVR